jgi:hypothetical protein
VAGWFPVVIYISHTSGIFFFKSLDARFQGSPFTLSSWWSFTLVYRIDRYFRIGLLIFQTSKELPYGRMTNSDGLIPCPVET